MAQGETGSAPRLLSRINRQGVPWAGLLLSWFLGSFFFFPFPSWHRLVAYISSVTVLSYCLGPVILLQLRQAMPDLPRPFRLFKAELTAPLAFVVSNWIVFWSGLATLRFTLLALLLVLLGTLFGRFLSGRRREGSLREEWGLAHSWWVLPYFGGMWVLSELGPGSLGGRGTIPFFADMGLVGLLSLLILRLALRATVPDEEIVRYMRELSEGPPSGP
ncbi:MAG: Amino acid permease-associated region [Leptospirillum sp. Group IV 'UBA BS']|nr:MAG: Amino acid permease-associated region [Leptospirillum sp. Group IV 'UBA BS']